MTKKVLFILFWQIVLVANSVSATPISELFATGYGATADTVIQNAAEAGLLQAVGSFVDAETIASLRAEITDGIKSQTKSVDTTVREVSNGSIQAIKVLELN